MKVSEQRKHRAREKSNKKLSSELLALTIGVFLCLKNIIAIIIVINVPIIETAVSKIPIVSSYDKNSISFFTHSVLCGFDQ